MEWQTIENLKHNRELYGYYRDIKFLPNKTCLFFQVLQMHATFHVFGLQLLPASIYQPQFPWGWPVAVTCSVIWLINQPQSVQNTLRVYQSTITHIPQLGSSSLASGQSGSPSHWNDFKMHVTLSWQRKWWFPSHGFLSPTAQQQIKLQDKPSCASQETACTHINIYV